jgi:precorrin-3B synthase
MNAPHRRGACPGLSAPMPTGDGLLVRLMPTAPIALDGFIALCEAAREHGNGTLEVTARGSLQVRGFTALSAPLFAATIAALDIAANDGVQVIADPLPDDAGALADTVRRAIAAAELALAAKVSVVIDSGGRLHLDALAADVRLRATETRLHVSLGGAAAAAAPLGTIVPERAAEVVVQLLRVIARQGPTARAVDVLRDHGIAIFRAAVTAAISPATKLPQRPPAEPIGRHPLRDGSIALGLALAFGHAQAEVLGELARIAASHGVRSVHPTPGRALLLLGLAEPDVNALTSAAEALGFVVRADDPRRAIVACPGKPACASGLIAARALAAEIAPLVPAQGGTIHISGCAKGCAYPAPAALTVVGTERGCGLVRNGSARATPCHHVDPADLVTEILRIAAPDREAVHG